MPSQDISTTTIECTHVCVSTCTSNFNRTMILMLFQEVRWCWNQSLKSSWISSGCVWKNWFSESFAIAARRLAISCASKNVRYKTNARPARDWSLEREKSDKVETRGAMKSIFARSPRSDLWRTSRSHELRSRLDPRCVKHPKTSLHTYTLENISVYIRKCLYMSMVRLVTMNGDICAHTSDLAFRAHIAPHACRTSLRILEDLMGFGKRRSGTKRSCVWTTRVPSLQLPRSVFLFLISPTLHFLFYLKSLR